MEWIIIGALLALFAGIVIWAYNKLVALRQAFKTAFSGIDVEMKRRLDLIPNLLESAKAYMGHESGTLQAVTEARSGVQKALEQGSANPGEQGVMEAIKAAESQLASTLGQFRMTMEAYPDLKASENMQQLSSQLSETEDRIANARQRFNHTVEQYNTLRQSFPVVVLAPMLGHGQNATLLELGDQETLMAAPRLDFSK